MSKLECAVQGYYKVFRHLKCAICGWLVYVKKIYILHIKFLLVSYPYFLKISFNLTKCGLSYGFKRDSRPFSEFTLVWTISWLIVSKNEFWRLPLIDWKSKVDWKVKLFPIECPVYQWQPPRCIFGGCQWENGLNPSKFWEWPRITF